VLAEAVPVGSVDVSGGKGPQLGLITRILPLPDGGVLLFDSRAVAGGSALFRYDSTGAFVGRIGGSGSGPGEYSGPVVGVAVNAAGVIALRVNELRRVNIYSHTGDVVGGFSIGSLRSTTSEIALLSDSAVLVAEEFSPGLCCPTKGMVRFDLEGQVRDSIYPRELWYGPRTEVPVFRPFSKWMVGPSGEILSIRSDAVGVLFQAPWRNPPLLWSQWEVDPPEFLAEERRAHRRELEWLHENSPGDMPGEVPSIPSHKQAVRDFHVDLDGNVWIQRSTQAYPTRPPSVQSAQTWAPPINFAERSVWVGFDSVGTLLGQIEFPVGTRQVRFAGRFAWVTQKDTLTEEVAVIKYRVRPP
jgi:hypothetical protein